MDQRMNLKEKLMLLGNEMVARGYHPADARILARMRKAHRGTSHDNHYSEDDTRSDRLSGGTDMIVLFTEWLNANPTAREILDELGLDWPVVERA